MEKGRQLPREWRQACRARLSRWLIGAASGAVLAIASPTVVLADVQLASVGCSDGSQFTVSVDTDTLNLLTTAVTNLNNEDLGLTCSITVQLPVSLGTAVAASNTPTQVYAVGGGSNDAGTHFAFSAHVDPDSGSPPCPPASCMGTAVIAPASGPKIQGSVFCYDNFGTTRFAVVGIQVQNPDGTTSPEVFQIQDTGPASSNPSQVWQINSGQMDCGTFVQPTNSVVQGNVVVRP
jgi:hypothetical protein